ncbi:MAG: hypothetical protein R3C03_22095 [Pirellulaceae bacterium]
MQRKKILDDATTKARTDLAVELKDRDERVNELQKMLKESQSNELELRKRERELEFAQRN